MMVSNYLYIPSTSTTMLQHFEVMATDLIERHKLGGEDLVMDIGSNDGTLLSFFRQKGLNVLGVDPASNLAHLARMKGVDTVSELVTKAAAETLTKKGN